MLKRRDGSRMDKALKERTTGMRVPHGPVTGIPKDPTKTLEPWIQNQTLESLGGNYS